MESSGSFRQPYTSIYIRAGENMTLTIEQIKKMSIEELEDIDGSIVSEEITKAVMSRLYKLGPYNDIFHLGCPNWPNCETEGCGED